ncbi:MAG: ABC transporter permease [Candidatus Methanofastidiosum sp.]|nr:ABC transporter permease [Methanofastidiosum sp.]
MLEKSKINIYFKYAATSLLRRKQRSLFSLLAIAISISSIVAISLMGNSVDYTLQSSVKYYFGGDLRLDMDAIGFRTGEFDFKETEEFIISLRDRGTIQDYTYQIDTVRGTDIQREGVTQTFLGLRGVEIGKYPLYNEIPVIEPEGAKFNSLIKEPYDIVVNDILVQNLKLKLGDTLPVLSDNGRTEFKVVGIVKEGGGVADIFGVGIIRHETMLELLKLNERDATSFFIKTQNDSLMYDAERSLKTEFIERNKYDIRVNNYVDQNKETIQILRPVLQFFGLAGIIALLVGAIGIITTMFISMKERKKEIGTMKAVGIKSGEVLNFFLFEALLLGVTGSLLGVILGIIISTQLVLVAEALFNTPLILVIDPFILVYGFLVGVFSVLTFQIVPAYIGSQIRPIIVLKDMEGEKPFYRDWGFIKIVFISFLVFGGILYINLRSLLLVLGVYGLILLMFIFTIVARYIIRLVSRFPTFNLVSLKLGLRSIERNHWTVATALLAIAIGLGSVGAVLTTGEGLKDFVADAFSSFADYDVQINGISDSKISIMEERLLLMEEVKTIYRTTDEFSGFSVNIKAVNGKDIYRYISDFTEEKRKQAEEGCLNVNIGGRNLEHNPLNLVTFRTIKGRLLDKQDIGKNRIIVSTRCVETFGFDVGDKITFEFNDYNVDMEIVGVYSPSFQGGGPPSSNLGIITSVETQDKIRRTSSNKQFNILEINNLSLKDYVSVLPPSQAKFIPIFSNPKANIVGLELENEFFGRYDTEGIIISTKLAQSLGLKKGDTLLLEENDYKKIFIIREIREGPFNKDAEIIIPYKALERTFPDIYSYTLNVIAKEGQLESLSKKTKSMFAPDYYVFESSEVLSIVNRLIDQVVIPISLLASFSLFVAIIVISNTMYLSILDRKREIGIMKAIGASNLTVLKNLAVENLAIGTIGGILSLVILYMAFVGLSLILQIGNIPISFAILMGIFTLSLVVSVLASIIPAYNTSKIRPLSVLRYE